MGRCESSRDVDVFSVPYREFGPSYLSPPLSPRFWYLPSAFIQAKRLLTLCTVTRIFGNGTCPIRRHIPSAVFPYDDDALVRLDIGIE